MITLHEYGPTFLRNTLLAYYNCKVSKVKRGKSGANRQEGPVWSSIKLRETSSTPDVAAAMLSFFLQSATSQRQGS